MANVLKVDTDWELVDHPPEASDPAIMYEVAAVATKIRNTHKVGGERVKEMQFFVESVETPGESLATISHSVFCLLSLIRKSRPHTCGGLTHTTSEVRVKAPDIAPLLQSICEASSLQPVTIDGKWPFYIQVTHPPLLYQRNGLPHVPLCLAGQIQPSQRECGCPRSHTASAAGDNLL